MMQKKAVPVIGAGDNGAEVHSKHTVTLSSLT